MLKTENVSISLLLQSRVFRESVLGQDTSEPQPSSGETQERHE